MESTDSLQSSESTVVDKDVLNVTRSTTQSQQWRVDGNANFSLGGFTIGTSGGISGSVQASSNRAVEHISEATQKSALRLQTLQKIEVARQSESTTQDTQSRTIQNPYRDRSLTLKVFELVKGYVVTTQLAEIRPLLVIEVTDLDLDRNFVLAQGDFLDQVFLDRTLAGELRDALQASRNPVSSTSRDLSRRYARLAFYYLFEAVNIFNVGSPIAPNNFDAASNTPFSSFADYGGLSDAINNNMGRVFTTLGTYFRAQADMYTPAGVVVGGPLPIPVWPGPSGNGHPLEVDMAVSLASAINDEWAALTADKVNNLMDYHDPTEIMRRVSGFLSIVNGLLQPLIKPSKDEADAAAIAQRAENVIERVIAHLTHNKAYYVQRFLDYMGRQTQWYALSDLLTRVLAAVPTPPPLQNLPQPHDMLELFNPRAGFLDGFQFVVPLFQATTPGDAITWIETLVAPTQTSPVSEFTSNTVDLIIPCDGFHIEPVPGNCILPDVPAPGTSATASHQCRGTKHLTAWAVNIGLVV